MSGIFKSTQDINWQDQTSFPIEQYISNKLNDVTLTADLATGAQTILLDTGHGFLVGEYIEIEHVYGGRPIVYHSRVITTATNQITTGKPVGFPILVANILSAKRTSINMAVDGSITPVKFDIQPPNGTMQWDLTRVIITMLCSGQPDDSKFGDLTALDKGIYFGKENDRFNVYLVNIVDNAGFRATGYDVTYSPRTLPTGSYGVAIKKTFAGPEKYGVTVRLNGAINESFVCYIQDAIDDLVSMNIKVMGHEVI